MKDQPTDEQLILGAVGALTEEERLELEHQLKESNEELENLCSDYGKIASLIGAHAPPAHSPPDLLKETILQKAFETPVNDGAFTFLGTQDIKDWQPLPVEGAWVKLLSMDTERGFATVLGKLDPGAAYPAHRHIKSEEIFMLTGDLQIGDRELGPGDFHRAEAGSKHDVNRSKSGCTLLAIISIEDLQSQFTQGAA